MSIFDRSRLESLRERAELADLEITTATPSELAKLDVSSLTVGQLITLADFIDAMETINNLPPGIAPPRGASPSSMYAPPSRAERRNDAAMYDEAASAVAAMSDDERKALLDRFRALMTGDIPDDMPVPTINGPIPFKDIPKDQDGGVPTEWLEANCTCDEHKAKRQEQGKAVAGDGTGLYL